LGPFGAHRFYTGKFATGLLQLALMAAACTWVALDFPYHDGELNPLLALGQLAALFLVNIWPVVDFMLIMGDRFTDRHGGKIRPGA
jgi:TM2 domain-containing membrane protein YozV